jgi:hypothetical protein
VKGITELSGRLLLKVKNEESVHEEQKELASYSLDNLQQELSSENALKTFWINIYNAYYQILAMNHNKSQGSIYNRIDIKIAGESFSLDDIEHGILRRYRWKWSKGYLPQIFTPAIIRKLAVHKIDYRIHFALNCGAVSCPPIAFYDTERIDQQLEMATVSFLEGETDIVTDLKTVTTSALLSWFSGDFGGKKGALEKIGRALDQDLSGYKLRFKKYNWEKQLANFSE